MTTDKHTYYGKESEIHNTCNRSDNCDLKVYRLYNVLHDTSCLCMEINIWRQYYYAHSQPLSKEIHILIATSTLIIFCLIVMLYIKSHAVLSNHSGA